MGSDRLQLLAMIHGMPYQSGLLVYFILTWALNPVVMPSRFGEKPIVRACGEVNFNFCGSYHSVVLSSAGLNCARMLSRDRLNESSASLGPANF